MTTQEIRELQAALGVKVDGIYGPITQRAHQAHLDAVDLSPVPNVTPVAANPWWASRAVLGLLASVLAGLLGKYGWEANADELTGILLQAVELGGVLVAFWGTVARKAPVDPTLVARLGTRDIRLPVPAYRESKTDDPRGSFADF